MNSTEVVTLMRQAAADLDATDTGRWLNSTLLNYIDQSNKMLVQTVLFPDCRIVQPTVAGQQLYQFPLFYKVKAVYIAGMPIDPSDLPTLEGRQIGVWDSSSTGDITSGSGGDFAMIGTANINAPQWSVQEPITYPPSAGSMGTWSAPKPDAQPWSLGQPPRYYWRGGYLGIVPPPANVEDLAVEGVRQPDKVQAMGQPMTSPDNFMRALVWDALSWAFMSNNDDQSRKQANECERRAKAEIRQLVAWRGEYPGEQPDGPKIRTLRPASSRFNVRRNR